MRKHKAPVVAKKPKKSENRELDSLPTQADTEICLYETDVAGLTASKDSAEYKEGLVQLKKKFLWETQEWSRRYGVAAEIRIYFTLKPEE